MLSGPVGWLRGIFGSLSKYQNSPFVFCIQGKPLTHSPPHAALPWEQPGCSLQPPHPEGHACPRAHSGLCTPADLTEGQRGGKRLEMQSQHMGIWGWIFSCSPWCSLEQCKPSWGTALVNFPSSTPAHWGEGSGRALGLGLHRQQGFL